MPISTKNLSALDDATEWVNIENEGVAHVKSNSGNGTVIIEVAINDNGDGAISVTDGSFTDSGRKEFSGSGGYFRLRCSAYTSGSFDATIYG